MSFGDNLQKLRKEKNISQENLAEQLNVSRQTIGKWENGTTYPEVEYLIQISDIFCVSIDTLLKGTVTGGEPAKSFSTNEDQEKAVSSVLKQRNRKIRFVIAVIFFIISPFFPGEPGAQSISTFFMTLCIAIGIGLLIYNRLTKDQEE